MYPPSSRWLVAAVLAWASLAASAQTMQPGLWEFSTQATVDGKAMPGMEDIMKQMAGLPPEQRKMLEDMMSKSGMGTAPGTGAASRLCITPAMAARDQLPVQTQGECNTQSSPRSGNTIRVKFSCSVPPSSGEGEITVTSPGSYTVHMTATTTMMGQTQKVQLDGNGRWLAADCGSVRP